MAQLTDERIARHAANLASAIQRIPDIADAMRSPNGMRSIEERFNRRPLESLEGQCPIHECWKAARR